MAWSWGDSFDLYAAPADAINGYWDALSSVSSLALVAGRFGGSQAISIANTSPSLIKSSGVNDAVHHFAVAFRQSTAIGGASSGISLQLSDGATGQCAVVFRQDGAILLTSGTGAGSTLATYTGAFPVQNTWYAFEFEVVINNTTGSFAVRKNGSTVNDFTATSLNTRGGTTNNYANKLTVVAVTSTPTGQLDDLFWRSDASSVAWMGDIRSYTRMPASDSSVQFSRSSASNTQTPFALSSTNTITAGVARYTAFTAAFGGTIGTATVSFGTGYTGNLKTTIFASSGSVPTAVLGSANVIVNPATGSNTLTFGTPITVARGAQYWIGFDSDTSSGTWSVGTGTSGLSSSTAYASFPVASPSTSSLQSPIFCTLTITIINNAALVNEPQQDGSTSYVYDSTPGDADFYTIGSIASTPVSTIAVTTRGYMQKSDTGTRSAAVQLKSGGTTVASPTLALTTSGWLWAWRTDVTDPNTSAAWTPTAVNNITVGPLVVS